VSVPHPSRFIASLADVFTVAAPDFVPHSNCDLSMLLKTQFATQKTKKQFEAFGHTAIDNLIFARLARQLLPRAHAVQCFSKKTEESLKKPLQDF